jgi:hypothetical protein
MTHLIEKKLRKTKKLIFFFKKIMLNNEIKKVNEPKKGMSTHVNVMNPWLGSLDQKHHKWKNHEAQSLANLKDETRKKSITQNLKLKNIIKRIRVKIKIKYKWDDYQNCFDWRVKLKRKIHLTK